METIKPNSFAQLKGDCVIKLVSTRGWRNCVFQNVAVYLKNQ